MLSQAVESSQSYSRFKPCRRSVAPPTDFISMLPSFYVVLLCLACGAGVSAATCSTSSPAADPNTCDKVGTSGNTLLQHRTVTRAAVVEEEKDYDKKLAESYNLKSTKDEKQKLTLKDGDTDIRVNYWVQGSGGPIVIHFHGLGQKAEKELPDKLRKLNMCFFAPEAKGKNWKNHNVVDWVSKMVDRAKGIAGCDDSKGVTLSGYSMGCMQLHKIMIENPDKRLARFVCSNYQLMDGQFKGSPKNGKFQKPAPTNTKVFVIKDWVEADPQPLKGRILWTYLGGKDKSVPVKGKPGKVVSAEESTEVWSNYLGADIVKLKVNEKRGHGMQKEHWVGVAELMGMANIPFAA